MYENIKLVVCDIDNTLTTKHHPLSPRAKAAIIALKEHGIAFGIASGRSLEEVKRMLKTWQLPTIDCIIALNGSVLWDETYQQVDTYFQLKKEHIYEIMELMKPFQHNALVYRCDQILTQRLDDVVLLSAQTAGMQAVVVSDEVLYAQDNAKIMFRIDERDMETIEAYVKQHPSSNYHAFKTQSTLLEFCDKRVSKAFALEKFCKQHKLSLSDVMAFGDTTNDNTMLQRSGVGVCMKNGTMDTLAIANTHTDLPCHEDGWADFIEHYFISRWE